MKIHQCLIFCILFLLSPFVLAETCNEKVDSSGAYVFSHSLPIGNGMVECYVKAKDGTGVPSKATIVFEDESGDKKPDNDCALDALNGEKLTSAITALMQRYTDEANAYLIKNPEQATKSTGLSAVGFFTGVYGQIVEQLTANRLSEDKCLSKYLRYLPRQEQSKKGEGNAKGSHPDFEGMGNATGLKYDITTLPEAQKKPIRDGAKHDYIFILYERGLMLDPKTGSLVKL